MMMEYGMAKMRSLLTLASGKILIPMAMGIIPMLSIMMSQNGPIQIMMT